MSTSAFQQLLDEYLLEARERADEVERQILRLRSADPDERHTAVTRARRELHTLKGNSGMMGFGELQELAHQMEDQVEDLDLADPHFDDVLAGLDRLRRALEAIRTAEPRDAAAAMAVARLFAAPRDAAVPETAAAEPVAVEEPAVDFVVSSVRVPFAKIDRLVEMQAETLIFRNRLTDAIAKGLALRYQVGDDPGEWITRARAAWEEVEEAQQELEKNLNRVQERVTEFGMVPLQTLYGSLRRLVHDESSRAGKRVQLHLEGGETPIDKTLLEAAGETLGHLVRNAVIHGIEPPPERRRRGKPETGRVRVSAALQASEVRIDVADDGAGINLDALEAQARQITGWEPGPADSPYSLLFVDGISTRSDADLSAGRGVGLSAVKRAVEQRSGRIMVDSERHRGTCFRLRLPVTTSILRSLLVAVDGEEYALPLGAVSESQRLDPRQRHEVNHAQVVRWRGQLIPLLDLGLAFGTARVERRDGYVIVIEANGRHRGLAADDLVGIRDIVVKGLDSIVGQPAGISGSTILGDGRVIMILDPVALVEIPPFVGSETAV